jgi:YbbR domain-containing protein
MSVPERITIRGARVAIADIAEVRARRIDLSEIADTTEIPVEPNLPSGVEVAKASQGLSVKVEVMGIEKKEWEFTADMIEVRGLAASLSGHVGTGSVIVTVFATREVMDGLHREDILLFVDASETWKAAEAVEMDVQYTCDKPIKHIVVEPAKVRVNIKRNGT